MAQPFSEKTQELLERADRAIGEAVKIREESRKSLSSAENCAFRFELELYRRRADEFPRK